MAAEKPGASLETAVIFRVILPAGMPAPCNPCGMPSCGALRLLGMDFAGGWRRIEGLCPQRATVTAGTATSPRDDPSSLSILLKSYFKVSSRSFPCLPFFPSEGCVPFSAALAPISFLRFFQHPQLVPSQGTNCFLVLIATFISIQKAQIPENVGLNNPKLVIYQHFDCCRRALNSQVLWVGLHGNW